MEQIEASAFKPGQATESSVTRPSIVLGEDDRAFLQWYGEASLIDCLVEEYGDVVATAFSTSQFRWLLPRLASDPCWLGYPQLFQLMYIGKAADCPFVKNRTENPEGFVLYATCDHLVARKEGVPIGPPRILLPLQHLLADGVYGIITPRKYREREF